MKRFEKYYKWIVAFVFGIALIAVYKTFDNFDDITDYIGVIIDAVKPFIGAFVIAYILNMPAKKIRNLIDKTGNKYLVKHSLGLSIFIIYVIAIVILTIILRMIIPAIYRNIIDLSEHSEEYIKSFVDYLNGFDIVRKTNLLSNGFNLSERIGSYISSIDTAQLGKYAEGVYSFTSSIFSVFVSLIASVYMLIDKERLQKSIMRALCVIFKENTVGFIGTHARKINNIFTNYLYSRLVCSVIMAVACSIVLMIFDVKYALILGIFIGAMDMIPYFGSVISCVIAIIVTFITGGMWQGIWVAVALIVLQQIDGSLLGPKIMGSSLEIRPLSIIFAVSVGGALFGFAGMLLSVPVLAIAKAIISDFIDEKEQKKVEAKSKDET